MSGTPCIYTRHTRLLLYPCSGGVPPPVHSSFKYVPAIYAKQSSLPRTIQPEQLALDIMAGVYQQSLLPRPGADRDRDRDRGPLCLRHPPPRSFPINSPAYFPIVLIYRARAPPRLSVIKSFSRPDKYSPPSPPLNIARCQELSVLMRPAYLPSTIYSTSRRVPSTPRLGVLDGISCENPLRFAPSSPLQASVAR